MISVTRSAQPKVLQKNAVRWLSILKELHEKAAPKKEIKRVQDKYRHPEVKDALVAMFYGKCAYCESNITTVTYGAIEHFYPKSKYIELTFEWSNLLLSCDVCNDASHKGTSFPSDNNGQPLLINPTDANTDPSTHLEFVWDDVSGLANICGRDQSGEKVIDVFDLNGRKDRKALINRRSRHIKGLIALLKLAQGGDQDAIALLQESCDPSSEYSAFAQVYIRPYIP